MIRNFISEILTSNSVKIWYNPGTTIGELHDYVKAAILKKLDMFILHIGTNDNGEDLSIIKKVKNS